MPDAMAKSANSLPSLTNHSLGVGEATRHDAQVDVVELHIWVHPLVLGIIDDEAEIRGNANAKVSISSPMFNLSDLQ